MVRKKAYHKVANNARDVQDILNEIISNKGTLIQIVHNGNSYVVFYEGYRRIQ